MPLTPDSDLWSHFKNIEEEGMAECRLCKLRLKNNRVSDLKHHIKIHNNQVEIDKYFEVNVLEKIAVCRTCKQTIQNRLCNIRLHMRRSHNIEMEVAKDLPLINTSRAPQETQPYNEERIQAVLKVAKRKMVEDGASNSKRIAHRMFIRMEKRIVIRSIMGLIIEDGISPHIFSTKYFKPILNPICESISGKHGVEFKMNTAEIEKIINSMANCIRNNFSNELSSRLLTIKIDRDLGAQPNVFCVSATFVNDGIIQNRALGVVQLNYNTQLQHNHIKEILYKYNIDSNQIISIFSDNTKSRYKRKVQNCEYVTEIKVLKLQPVLCLGETKIEPYLSSFAQICLLDIFKNANILQTFLECRNLVLIIQQDKQVYAKYNITVPELDSPWNAGSTCKMMSSLLEVRKFLETTKPPEVVDKFSNYEHRWLFIEAFCTATNYLQKAILQYYDEELHIGDFYAQWLKCKLLTEKFATENPNSNNFLTIILAELLKSIEHITNKLLQMERVTACLYLDPRFQRILSPDQQKIAVEYLKKVWCRSKLYMDDDNTVTENGATEFMDDEDALLDEFLSEDLPVKDKGSKNVFEKIEKLTLAFQTADTNVLSFWKQYKTSDPDIYNLSTICFAIPATEVSAQ